jgi:hypothetical protein
MEISNLKLVGSAIFIFIMLSILWLGIKYRFYPFSSKGEDEWIYLEKNPLVFIIISSFVLMLALLGVRTMQIGILERL